MSLEFWNTQMGRRFIEGTVPNLVKSIDRLTAAVEKMPPPEQPAPAPVSGLPLQYILDYVKSVPGKDWLGGDAFDDFGVCHRQLRALWTAYSITNGWESGTVPFNASLEAVWDAIVAVSDIDGSSHVFADYDCFAEYMCEDLE